MNTAPGKKNSLNRSFALSGNNNSGSCMYGMCIVPDSIPSTLCVSSSFNLHSNPMRGGIIIPKMKWSLGEGKHVGKVSLSVSGGTRIGTKTSEP